MPEQFSTILCHLAFVLYKSSIFKFFTFSSSMFSALWKGLSARTSTVCCRTSLRVHATARVYVRAPLGKRLVIFGFSLPLAPRCASHNFTFPMLFCFTSCWIMNIWSPAPESLLSLSHHGFFFFFLPHHHSFFSRPHCPHTGRSFASLPRWRGLALFSQRVSKVLCEKENRSCNLFHSVFMNASQSL